VEQCEREHFAERLDSQRKEGCRIEGGLRVNKVIGNFHIAPGRSFSNGNLHVHDLKNYFDTPVEGGHVFTHIIHHLRFGPQLPEEVTKKLGSKAMPWTNHHLNPLDNTQQATTDPAYNFMYFVKVVPTSYLPLGWERTSAPRGQISDDSIGLGAYGHSLDGSVETHQYSVTSHKRSLNGGDDSSDGHKERFHARGGIPGVFFSYVSPEFPPEDRS
jgi:endoplasmic reticulum-Golgi intermediate compartment protein 3